LGNKKVFNDIISDYAIGRPGYPSELFRDIIEYSMLKNDAKILEIGSGPGQATEFFVENRYSVTGLELGEKQVEYLLGKFSDYQNFDALCTSFEDYNCEQENKK